MRTLFALALLCAPLFAVPRWELQYFLDEDDTNLVLTDIAFPSAQRGLASGAIIRKGNEKPVVLVTSNGGQNWTQVQVPEPGLALYCLDETACWMVTGKGIWFSSEAGRSWRRIKRENGLNTIWFKTRERGWALGIGKKLIETRDGGKTWSKVHAAEQLKTSAERTNFNLIRFLSDKQGVIAARSEPVERRRDVPLWMDTDPEFRREHPTLQIMLQTNDGGETWTESSSSQFGRISRLAPTASSGKSLALIEFDRYFIYPSEVYQVDFRTGKSEPSYRDKNFAPRDVLVLSDGTGLMAGHESQGAVSRLPIPGKVRVLQSSDLKTWFDMSVDYRAVARRVRFAGVDRNHVWLATDTGMILRLVP